MPIELSYLLYEKDGQVRVEFKSKPGANVTANELAMLKVIMANFEKTSRALPCGA